VCGFAVELRWRWRIKRWLDATCTVANTRVACYLLAHLVGQLARLGGSKDAAAASTQQQQGAWTHTQLTSRPRMHTGRHGARRLAPHQGPGHQGQRLDRGPDEEERAAGARGSRVPFGAQVELHVSAAAAAPAFPGWGWIASRWCC